MRLFKRRRLVKKGLTSAVKRASGHRHRALVYLEAGVLPRALTGLLVLVALTFVVSKARDLGLPYVGEKARQDIIATRPFSYADDARRFEEMERVRAEVPAISRLDETKATERFAEYDKLLVRAAELTAREAAEGTLAGEDTTAVDATSGAVPTLTERELLEQEVAAKLAFLSAGQRDELLSDPASAARVQKLRQTVLGLATVRTYTAPGYRPPALGFECISRDQFLTRRLPDAVEGAFRADGVDAGTLTALQAMAANAVVFVDDGVTTLQLRERRAASVGTQYTTVPRGTTLIHEGEQITPAHRAQIRAYFEELDVAVARETRLSYQALVALVGALFVGMTALYLWRFEPRVFAYNSKLILIGGLSLLAVGLTVGIGRIETDSEWWRDVLRFPVLVALPVLVIAMTLPTRAAFFFTVMLSVLSGIQYHALLARMTIHPTYVLLGLVGGCAAALYARTIRYRKEFVRTGAMIGLLSFFVTALLGMFGGVSQDVLLREGLGGLGAGILATTLAWVLLPAVETVFHLTTNVSLIELGDSNHPLLKRMVMEAPGTYHHSLIVGNLAEAAAEAIGANPLLARVGALYHDIGKLKKPDYFSENEQQARSRHDTLIPSMSSLIITSHVKDGIDLGYKYRLKPAILDIIREHHGTSLVYFFYKRAAATAAAEQGNGKATGGERRPPAVDEADYRYPGPKPQSKESAIIMLADAVEAAARAMDKPTASKMRTLIRELMLARFNDGQLDESELTLRDLHRIQEAFTHIILGTFHQRVKYPKEGEPSEGEQADEGAEAPEPTGVTKLAD
ncbi:MAG: HDIG domain-containing protein [Verrucomicrobia bacterium]|nr:HDIG domain-containing protein [Verrucomicrobiota bacterium]